MALESGTHIDDLLATNPTASDPIHQADDHIRLIKATLKASLPGLDDALLNSSGNVLTGKMGSGTANSTTYLRGDKTWAIITAGGTFDIHDDVTQSATIADADRVPFSDENAAGDPMRYTTAANLANYVQDEIITVASTAPSSPSDGQLWYDEG